VPTMIGVDHRGLVEKIGRLVPDYMVMGERGMADMGEMEMPLPDNTLPMMSGQGPYGAVEMGGMFTVVKIRREQAPGDYRDPGWYAQPAGTQAYEWTGAPQEPARSSSPGGGAMPAASPATPTELTVRKPGSGHSGHH
ncbi:MAG TPA: copper oxidase, partial [Usitatibacter sp.]|nr:copper oxidase [Usitatibacter sp.]